MDCIQCYPCMGRLPAPPAVATQEYSPTSLAAAWCTYRVLVSRSRG